MIAAAPASAEIAFSAAQNSSPASSLSDLTIHLSAPIQLRGDALRLRLDNRYGERRVSVIGAVRKPGSSKLIRFKARVKPGELKWTDKLPVRAHRGDLLEISLYLKRAESVGADLAYLQSPVSVSEGRALSDADASPAQYLPLLDRISVSGRHPDRPVIVCVGASGTDGAGAGVGESYPSQLSASLSSRGGRAPLVFNAGIGGNKLLTDGPNSVSLLKRMRSDVFSLRPDLVIALIGTNDLLSGEPSYRVISGLKQLRSWFDGAGAPRILLGTFTPFKGMIYSPEDRVAAALAERARVNAWLRAQRRTEIIDFDSALRDPSDPDALDQRYAYWDRLHPNALGYQRMAAAALEKISPLLF